jgi:exopolysaccharide biosynthesis protein
LPQPKGHGNGAQDEDAVYGLAGGSGVLQAALSSSPIMVEQGNNVLNLNHLDTKQATVKSYRGFIGWKGRTITLGIVRGATVIDSAAVAAAMGLDYAVNLDGGGSTAMIQNGSYVLGPGRNLPNAILLVP